MSEEHKHLSTGFDDIAVAQVAFLDSFAIDISPIAGVEVFDSLQSALFVNAKVTAGETGIGGERMKDEG